VDDPRLAPVADGMDFASIAASFEASAMIDEIKD
jgi:hypothetical protein